MRYDYNKWSKNPYKIFCKCGCKKEIIITKYHKYKNIPEYIHGHHTKRISIISESYKKWLEDGKQKIFCRCKCGEEIIIKKHHKRYGIPKYIKGHYIKIDNPMDNSESRKKIQGKNNVIFGKHRSEEFKRKNRERQPYFGKHLPEEHKQKMIKNQPYRCGEDASNWQGGKSFEPYCHKFNRRKKEEIRNQYNRKCYICRNDEKDNITKKGKTRKLSIHHIDGDKEQGCNGKQWKLIPLCIHCHCSKKEKEMNLE